MSPFIEIYDYKKANKVPKVNCNMQIKWNFWKFGIFCLFTDGFLGLSGLVSGSGVGGAQMALQSQGKCSFANGPSEETICTTILESPLKEQLDLPVFLFLS